MPSRSMLRIASCNAWRCVEIVILTASPPCESARAMVPWPLFRVKDAVSAASRLVYGRVCAKMAIEPPIRLIPLEDDHIARYLALSGDPVLLQTMGWKPFAPDERERFRATMHTSPSPTWRAATQSRSASSVRRRQAHRLPLPERRT